MKTKMSDSYINVSNTLREGFKKIEKTYHTCETIEQLLNVHEWGFMFLKNTILHQDRLTKNNLNTFSRCKWKKHTIDLYGTYAKHLNVLYSEQSEKINLKNKNY